MARIKYLKNTRLKNTLDEYSKNLSELIAVKPKQFDISSVANMITSTPNRKWNAAQGVINNTVEKKQCEISLKSLRAVKMLEASRLKKDVLSNAEDRKAYVDNDAEIQEAEIDLINAEAQLVAAKLAYDTLDDLFTAGKKIMDWLSEQDKAQKQFEKYTNELARNG